MQKLGVRLKERLSRSAFFFGAVLFHLVLALMLIGYVVWQAPPAEEEVAFAAAPLPAQAPVPPTAPTDAASDHAPLINPTAIHLDSGSDLAPRAPIVPSDFGNDSDLDAGNRVGLGTKMPPISGQPRNSKPWVNLERIKEIALGREVNGSPDFLKFPIYLAKYADGDWDCDSFFHDGQLTSGALPNLMAKIHEWSHGELDGRQIQVVALDSPEILRNPPPFIFFTGHRDFHLTPAEIANLRAYLQVGGAIWGDSAFAGDGSRFDVAFRREMKYVLPDADLQFQPLPPDHPIFTTTTKFPFDDIPPGMNRRADPIEAINLDGKLAVLYTPNDYSDLLTLLLQPGLNEDEAKMNSWDHWEPNRPLYTDTFFVWHAATYFRNYEPGSAMAACKLSMNILIHLLHRYDDELLLTP
jgi:hypothetical protein